MNIKEIDKNFNIPTLQNEKVKWVSVLDNPISICGVNYDEKEGKFVRLPLDIASSVSKNVLELTKNTAGGRVRFRTNSNIIAVKVIADRGWLMPHITLVGSHGLSMYINGNFRKMFTPEIMFFPFENKTIEFDSVYKFENNEMNDIEIYMPLYNGVNEMYIAIGEDCKIEKPLDYVSDKKVCFYGSSITQGGCASRPGNDYEAVLSRRLGFDFDNMGFSGSCKGESEMAKYLASKHYDVYVIDYDWNADYVSSLESTHYPLYKTIREENKTSPIIFISKPDFIGSEEDVLRREVIKNTYRRAISENDNNVYFIDGESLFTDNERFDCTVDGTHPNDLGFRRMADTIEVTLKKLI